MADLYGSYQSSSADRKWRAWLNYSVSTSYTSVSYSANGYLYLAGSSSQTTAKFLKNGATGRLYIDGANVKSYTNSSGAVTVHATQHWLMLSHSASWSRGTSAASHSSYWTISTASGSWQGSSTAGTAYISVPALDSWTVAYYGNGATGGSTDWQTKYYNINLALRYNGFTRPGYSFWHWNTASNNTGTTFNAGATFTGNYGLSLYAIWNPIIYYNGNGATGGSTASQTKTYNTNISLQYNGFTRTGYSFWHWNTASNNTGTTYNAGATYTSNSTATLYAIWNPIIYYNANGGTGAPGSQTKTYNTNLTLSTVTPTRSGYDFVCWNTNASGTGTNYYPGGTYTSNSTATLYAIWKRKPVYVKKDGAWKSGVPYVKVNGTWHENTGVFVKRNGTWIPL